MLRRLSWGLRAPIRGSNCNAFPPLAWPYTQNHNKGAQLESWPWSGDANVIGVSQTGADHTLLLRTVCLWQHNGRLCFLIFFQIHKPAGQAGLRLGRWAKSVLLTPHALPEGTKINKMAWRVCIHRSSSADYVWSHEGEEGGSRARFQTFSMTTQESVCFNVPEDVSKVAPPKSKISLRDWEPKWSRDWVILCAICCLHPKAPSSKTTVHHLTSGRLLPSCHYRWWKKKKKTKCSNDFQALCYRCWR